MKRITKISILILLAAALGAGAFFWLNGKYKSRLEMEKAKITQETQQKIVLEDIKKESASAPEKSKSNPDAQATATPQNVPAKKLLVMPFYSQTPLGNWDAVHEEMCEEASILNAGLYLQGKKLSAEEYDRELLKLKDLGDKLVGTWVSTSIADTKKLSDAYFSAKGGSQPKDDQPLAGAEKSGGGDTIKSKIIDNPTIAQIEVEVAAGHPVIVPLAGREIGNPNYTPPGPIYHVLVIKGYDEKFFITNDVGTRKGDSYVFAKKIIMDKMHDWNTEDIHLGAKKALVLYE